MRRLVRFIHKITPQLTQLQVTQYQAFAIVKTQNEIEIIKFLSLRNETRILLGDNTGGEVVMQRLIIFQCSGTCISAVLPFTQIQGESRRPDDFQN
jgi:hypothetical protein